MLTKKQLTNIRELQSECEEYDGIQLKLNWDMLKMRDSREINDFFHYSGEKLAGFLAIYGFGNKVELCGMVSPLFRRKGIFSQLFKEALAELKKRNPRLILLNAPADSDSGKAFIQKTPCRFLITEYQMQWEGMDLKSNSGITLRPSVPADSELEKELEMRCFGFTKEETEEYLDLVQKDPLSTTYIIVAQNQDVGKLRVSEIDGEAWIYGFAILPEHQAKGIGRNALKQIIQKENKKGFPIFLEVEAENGHALRLYQSCGFKIIQSQDYYKMELPAVIR